jgi:hypothetical protein
MGVTSTVATSRRGYLSQNELEQMANISITDTAEADDQISQAEELIDAYVGPQDKYMKEKVVGYAASAGSSNITLETDQQNIYDIDYFKLCQIEIIGGTGEGQRRKVTGATKAGVLTIYSAWVKPPDTTSYYKISQLGKFPRVLDVETATHGSDSYYYKIIPEAVKRAVVAQIEFMIEMGTEFFIGDSSEFTKETIGDYSYEMAGGRVVAKLREMISAKSKMLLKGILNRTGTIVV